jgi:3-oxoacyl-[acyl-carrier protein] reductase
MVEQLPLKQLVDGSNPSWPKVFKKMNKLDANDYQLSNKNALVTGASRSIGIGAATARALATMGTNVFTTFYCPYDSSMSWSSVPAEATNIIEELKSHGVKADGVEADLSDHETPKTIFDRAEQVIGPIDILINNATCDYSADIYSLTDSLLDKHYAVNIRGATLLCSEFASRHDGRSGGRIINLTSGQGICPMPNNLPYAMTKGAIEALTISLSVSLANKGITVNAVDPGPTDTGWMSPDLLQTLKKTAPFGRVGTPEDAMRLILFLASTQAQWITGQIIRSRGGL